ncbi:MAG: cytochrome c [Williamsia sp.]|nr:cytochrome c [Williamsia sp.]
MKIKCSLVAVFVIAQLACFAGAPTEPKAIFTARCASCHAINKVLTGPALAGIDQRRTMDWIISFVHSPQRIIHSGDVYAAALFEKHNRVTMPDHPDLTADDIKGIVEYIKSESKTAVEEKAPFPTPGRLHPDYHPLSLTGNYGFFICYLLFVAVLIGAMLFAVNVQALKRKAYNA